MTRWKFRTEGRVIKRDIGEALIECLGKGVMRIVEESDVEVLGVTALENLALEVDPTTKKLRKCKAVLAL